MRALAATLALIVVSSVACGRADRMVRTGDRSSPARRPNLILIILDATRADHLSGHGYSRETTPALDRLAREGVRFSRVYATSSWTIPSIASLFSGVYQSAHGVYQPPESDARVPLDDRFVTLAEALSAAGYETVAFTSQPWLAEILGYHQGFESFECIADMFDPLEGETVTARARNWILGRRGSDRPYFIYLHIMGPHTPYTTPQLYRGMFGDAPATRRIRQLVEDLSSDERNRQAYRQLHALAEEGALSAGEYAYLVTRYDEKLRYTDDVVGAFIDALEESGELEKTVVAVTADHGEAFGEHGHLFHARSEYLEEIHIPFILHGGAGYSPGTVVDDVGELIDVYPTLLDVLGLAAPPGVMGTSLLPPSDGRRLSYARSEGKQYRIILDGWTATFAYEMPEPLEVFDLGSDPHERHPLRPGDIPADVLERLRSAALHSSGLIREGSRPAPQTRTIDEATRQRLHKLGYIN